MRSATIAAALRALADEIDPPAPRPAAIVSAPDPWTIVDEEQLVREHRARHLLEHLPARALAAGNPPRLAGGGA